MATSEKGRKHPQGVTQAIIFRFILIGGGNDFRCGSATEPQIREHLRRTLDIRSERSVKTHLENMENANLITKTRNPEHSNTWTLAYMARECYDYICHFVTLSQSEGGIAHDIKTFFHPSIRNHDTTHRMIAAHRPLIDLYFNATLNKEFTDKRKFYDGDFGRVYASYDPDDEMMHLVYTIAGASPTLFSLATPRPNRAFLALVWVLMNGEKYPDLENQTFFRWIIMHVIAAALITDFRVYGVCGMLLSGEERPKFFGILSDCGITGIFETHLPQDFW